MPREGGWKRQKNPGSLRSPDQHDPAQRILQDLEHEGMEPVQKTKSVEKQQGGEGQGTQPNIFFAFAFATDKEPEDLLAYVSHKWHRRGGILLKIKELQTFESKTILCIFNIFTSTPKKTFLYVFQEILEKAMKEAQEHDSMDFLFDFNHQK
jgi:hypothetical protein